MDSAATRNALDVNAVLPTALFGLGRVLISASAWFARKDIEIKRRGGTHMTRQHLFRPGSMGLED